MIPHPAFDVDPWRLVESALEPTAVLRLASVLLWSALTPTAVFKMPMVLSKSAAAPMAVFWFPELRTSVPAPTPVLKPASTLLLSENQPTAVFARPVLVSRLERASCPSAVLNPGYPPSGGGFTACAFGKNARQATASTRPIRNGRGVILS